MKLDKPLMVASGSNLLPRIVSALLLVLLVVIALALLAAAKPWKLGVPMPEWNLKQCIRVSLWWAGLLALPLLGILVLTTQYWTTPLRQVRHAGLKSKMPRLFWPIVAVITILYTTTAAPRLRQSLWDDEIYAVRKIVLGTDRIGSDGSVMIKQLPWWRTLWHCEGARNHGLQSVLSRLSLRVYQAVVHPSWAAVQRDGNSLAKFHRRSFVHPGASSAGCAAGISLGWRRRRGSAGASSMAPKISHGGERLSLRLSVYSFTGSLYRRSCFQRDLEMVGSVCGS